MLEYLSYGGTDMMRATLRRHCRIIPAAAAAALLLIAAESSANGQQADLLLANGKVYVGSNATDDTVPAFREAVAIKDGAILFVGSAEAARGPHIMGFAGPTRRRRAVGLRRWRGTWGYHRQQMQMPCLAWHLLMRQSEL